MNEAKSPPLTMTSPTHGATLADLDRLPPICGDFNMRIDRQGTWYYQGSPIGRLPLVKLFSKVLRRDEAGDYWLTTPVENGRIAVEDVPFIAVEAIIDGQGSARVVKLRTNVDDVVILNADHPLRVEISPQGDEPRPYVRVRANLDARLARSVYYHLVELGESRPDDPSVFGLWSAGQFFTLGRL